MGRIYSIQSLPATGGGFRGGHVKMKERIVVICPGRGTYTRETTGYLKSFGQSAKDRIHFMDENRKAAGLQTITELDASPFKAKVHMGGEHASPLIYAL